MLIASTFVTFDRVGTRNALAAPRNPSTSRVVGVGFGTRVETSTLSR
jgi:hypothetical protein